MPPTPPPPAKRRGPRLGPALPASRASGKPSPRGSVLNSEVDYTADEAEFLKAVDTFKRAKRRPFPTLSELLAVLKGLGYTKVKVTGE